MSRRPYHEARAEHLRALVEENHGELRAGPLGRIVGVDRTTVLRWLRQDFPELYAEVYAPLHTRIHISEMGTLPFDLPDIAELSSRIEGAVWDFSGEVLGGVMALLNPGTAIKPLHHPQPRPSERSQERVHGGPYRRLSSKRGWGRNDLILLFEAAFDSGSLQYCPPPDGPLQKARRSISINHLKRH